MAMACWWAMSRGDEGQGPTVAEAGTHGDVGVACDSYGREAVMVDGVTYVAGSKGPAVPLASTATLSTCQVMPFDHYAPVFLKNDLVYLGDLLDALDARREVEHAFDSLFSVVATGSFGEVDVKCDDDRVLDFVGLEGTLVGIRVPTSLSSLAPAGWHIHLLSQGRRIAGHLMGFEGASLACQVCRYDDCSIRLAPERCSARSVSALA